MWDHMWVMQSERVEGVNVGCNVGDAVGGAVVEESKESIRVGDAVGES